MGVIRHGAKVLYAYSEATVPKITVILRKAYGGGYIAMNSRHLKADFMFAWPTAEIAVMGPEGAANIIFRKEIKSTFIKSFLHYVPFAVLGAMTIPDVLYSTGDMRTAAVGLVVAVFLAWKGKSLLTVALAACAAVLAAQGILLLF